jgi:pimeloyl-ACP methyl ester carboxylesterase
VPKPPLVLVHGAWLSSESWDNYAAFFGARGYEVTAPEWPRRQSGVAAQREHAADLADLGVEEVVDHLAGIVEGMDEKPVILGHSFGGLYAQLLLDRGLGRAGVALSPAPPKGILRLPFSTLKAAAPALAHPSTRHGIVTLTLEEFTYGFVNTVGEDEAAAAYERYAVPETGRIFYEDGFANLHRHGPTEIDWGNPERAPLLFVGAEEDNTVPASVTHAEYKKAGRAPARTDYVTFAGRPHLHMGVAGWEEPAEAIAGWLDEVLA